MIILEKYLLFLQYRLLTKQFSANSNVSNKFLTKHTLKWQIFAYIFSYIKPTTSIWYCFISIPNDNKENYITLIADSLKVIRGAYNFIVIAIFSNNTMRYIKIAEFYR